MAKSGRWELGLLCLALLLCWQPGCKPDIPGGLVAGDQPLESTEPAAQAAAPVDIAAAPADYSPPRMPEPSSPPPSPPADAPPAPSIPIVANSGLIPVDVANSSGAQQGTAPPAQVSSPAPPNHSAPAFRLSAGVAVPQSLPIGTVMGMSVDYQLAGPLNQSSQYVWVVSSQGGGRVEVALQPQAQGNLQAFFAALRPEHRPFNSHIDEIAPGGRRTRVSNVATMQTSY